MSRIITFIRGIKSSNSKILDIKNLIYTRYLISFIVGLTMAIAAESATALEAKYIIKRLPGFLSCFFIITSCLGILQFILTKVKIKYAIWIPLLIDIITVPFILILFFNNQMFIMLIFTIFTEVFTSLFYTNRKNIVSELLKSKCKLNKFYNYAMSLFSLGSVIGYLVSFYLIKIGVSFEIIWISSLLLWFPPTTSIIVYENIVILINLKGLNSSG